MFEIYNFFIYFLVGFIITLVLNFGFGQLNINTTNFDYEKFSAYECGFDPFEHTRFSFDVRFYLIAIFYIIFDLEVIFLFPLSISVNYLYGFDYFFTFGFIFFLFFGVVYEFWKGKLDWSKGLNFKNSWILFFNCNSYFQVRSQRVFFIQDLSVHEMFTFLILNLVCHFF